MKRRRFKFAHHGVVIKSFTPQECPSVCVTDFPAACCAPRESPEQYFEYPGYNEYCGYYEYCEYIAIIVVGITMTRFGQNMSTAPQWGQL